MVCYSWITRDSPSLSTHWPQCSRCIWPAPKRLQGMTWKSRKCFPQCKCSRQWEGLLKGAVFSLAALLKRGSCREAKVKDGRLNMSKHPGLSEPWTYCAEVEVYVVQGLQTGRTQNAPPYLCLYTHGNQTKKGPKYSHSAQSLAVLSFRGNQASQDLMGLQVQKDLV